MNPAFLAPQAWIDGHWQHNVLLSVAPDGCWAAVEPDAPAALCQAATPLAGPVLPGLVNAHSHAFQRAIAGLTESPGADGRDNFWSWRDRMYRAANRISPAQLEAIASQLYAELLAGGYTQVCEFHYLHNDRDGQPYAHPLELSLALVRAAQRTGIGLTLLPTLYMRAGFGVADLRDDQRRFASTPASVLRTAEAIAQLGLPNLNAGIAIHSLRAVDAGALRETAAAARGAGWPVHIHVAEQQQEVDDCLAHTRRRPIEWLLEEAGLDARWNLVHATHTVPTELQGVAASGASIVLAPSTEANLGDGIFDLPGHAAVGGRWSIGSDSHVSRRWTEELRLLEYSQRLALRRRNVAATVTHSSGNALFAGALAGGSAAAGQRVGGLVVGQRADFCVVDVSAPALLGVPEAHWLDALIFSTPDAALLDSHVAGRRVGALEPDGQRDRAIAFAEAMRAVWA